MDTESAAGLEGALERGELVVLYQPIVDLDTLRMVGAEALLRWDHPARGLLPPADFIPAAEATGLIVPIGAWTLREACQRGVAWRSRQPAGSTIGVAVNVSGRQLRDPGFVADVRDALERSGLEPHALLLELTETLLLEYEVVGAALDQLKELGVRLAVDDFGTGHSSLEYLARFPLDVLKVDKSYVALLDGHVAQRAWEAAALVRGILLLGHSLGLRTVAEGVATGAQLRLLRKLGCQLGQGRLFDGPLDPDSLETRLGERLGPTPG
jgi:EAL domain-containing protein (putative c-di-GMP-specific phosphodiesterase class I)